MYTLWVVIVDVETNKIVDIHPANIKDMDNIEQARLAARLMAGTL